MRQLFGLSTIALLLAVPTTASADFAKTDKSAVRASPATSSISSIESGLDRLSKKAAAYTKVDAGKYVREFEKTQKYTARNLEKLRASDPNWNTSRYTAELARLEVLYKRALADRRAGYIDAGYKNVEKKRVAQADGAPKATVPPAAWCEGVTPNDSMMKTWAERPDNFAHSLAISNRPTKHYCVAPNDKLLQEAVLVALQRLQNKSGWSTRLTIAKDRVGVFETRDCGSTKRPREVDYVACNNKPADLDVRMWWWNATPSQQTPMRNFAMVAALVGKRRGSVDASGANRFLMAEQLIKGISFEKLERQLKKEWGIGMLAATPAKQLMFAQILEEFEVISQRFDAWRSLSQNLAHWNQMKSVAKKARAQWNDAASDPIFRELLAFEANYFSGTMPGPECDASLQKHWTKYLEARRPKSPEQLARAVGDPLGARILIDQAICAMANGEADAALVHTTLLGLGGNLNHYAPDYYASQRIMEAVGNGSVRGGSSNSGFGRQQGGEVHMYSAMGAIDSASLFGSRLQFDKPIIQKPALQSVKKQGSTFDIKFKTRRYKVRIPINCRKTGRISRIRSDGRVEYEQNCRYKTVTEKRTPTPISVSGVGDCKLKRGDRPVVTSGYGGNRPLLGIIRGNNTICVGGSKYSGKVFTGIREEI